MRRKALLLVACSKDGGQGCPTVPPGKASMDVRQGQLAPPCTTPNGIRPEHGTRMHQPGAP
eukprot:15433627-Alexandrium_andersonii.AAC.1